MLYLIIMFLIFFNIGSCLLLIMQSKALYNTTKSLKSINSAKTNMLLTIEYPNKYLGGLIKEINNTLKERQRIEADHRKMDLELRQIISNMSHDLRTPLTSIKGYIKLIEDKEGSDEERKQYIEIVKNRANSLQKLINNFYELSRIQANESELKFSKVNISKLLCELIASYYDSFIEKGLDVNININEKVPFIITDENSAIRIFSNLIQNLLKHGKDTLEICLEQEGKYIITRFTNGTENLTLNDVEHLFDRFFTADRMRSGRNTGLGLAISKKLVERLGNIISATLIDDKLSIEVMWKINNYLEVIDSN